MPGSTAMVGWRSVPAGRRRDGRNAPTSPGRPRSSPTSKIDVAAGRKALASPVSSTTLPLRPPPPHPAPRPAPTASDVERIEFSGFRRRIVPTAPSCSNVTSLCRAARFSESPIGASAVEGRSWRGLEIGRYRAARVGLRQHVALQVDPALISVTSSPSGVSLSMTQRL